MSSKFSRLAAETEAGGLESCGARKRWEGCSAVRDVMNIPLDRISPDPDQPRKDFDEEALYHLAGSLKSKGQLQPVRVRYDVDADHYYLVAGERRWRAAQIATLDTLQCVVDNHDPDQRLTQVVENLQREDLTPMEQARVFQELIDTNGWGKSELANNLHVSPSTVSRSLALLELPPEDQAKVDAGELKGLALRDRVRKRTNKPRSKSKSKKVKFHVEGGFTVTVSSNKTISKADALGAIAAVLDQETPKQRKAA